MSAGCSSIRGNCTCCCGSSGGGEGGGVRVCKGEGGKRNQATVLILLAEYK